MPLFYAAHTIPSGPPLYRSKGWKTCARCGSRYRVACSAVSCWLAPDAQRGPITIHVEDLLALDRAEQRAHKGT